MANTIEYAKTFQTELDKQMIAGSTSGWMELNSNMVKYSGGNECKIPKVVMDGLADYDRATGFVDGAVTLSWQTQTLTQDRGRTFSLDSQDVDESNFVLSAGAVLGEFQRTKVIPEVDAYRYSLIATKAIAASKATNTYVAAKDTIISKLLADIYAVLNLIGDGEPLVITLSMAVAAILDEADKIEKKLEISDFKQGDIQFKVKSIDGNPILRVPSARLKTAYVFNDGTTTGQTAGGFTASGTAKDINWIIASQKSLIAVSKTDKMRIFDPNTNQKADAWKMDYRKYHDLWVPDNKIDGIWINLKQ